jgi:zinc finger/BTB domain-containing protein 17
MSRIIDIPIKPIEFKCTCCDAQYKTRSGLHNHKRIKHADQDSVPRISCKQCGKVFTSLYLRTKHINDVHKGIKHICPNCNKDFTTSTNLRRHIRDSCDKSDITEESKRDICDDCGAKVSKFYTRKHKKYYCKSNAIIPRWVCRICGVLLTYSSQYKHMVRSHPGVKYINEIMKRVE